MEFLLYYALLFIISIFFCLRYRRIILNQKRDNKLPPSPPALPILGHLRLLKDPIHRSLQSISNKYGPIFYLRLGVRATLVVSSPSIAEECFTKNDIVFANRPQSLATKFLSYNNTTVGSAAYGDYWRNLRRVSAINIFSPLSLHNLSAIRVEEIRLTVKKLMSESDLETWKELDLNTLFKELVDNTIMRMTCGKRWYKSADIFKQIIPLTNKFDYFPILKWIGGFGGYLKKLKNLRRDRDRVLQDIIDDCRRRNNGEGVGSIDKRKKTVVEALLSVQEAEPNYYTDDIIKGLILIMFTAGTDTTSLTMQWAMSLLLDHPEVLEKAKIELENKLPQGHLIEESDLPKLPYLSCIINETLRLFPAAPLLLPHFSSEDCTINGYIVPKDTTLFVNAWAIHRDPNVWEEPTKFKPERFEGIELGSDQGFKFLPFGKGRRACPGNTLAMRFVGLVLGTLIQWFDWKRLGAEMVDLQEKGGLTIHKAKPLKALCRPRQDMINSLSLL